MNEYTASNGVKITRYTDSLDAVDGDASAAWMAPRVVKALREFFRAEEDERLGRWRWPENPEFVVYPGSLSMREAQVVSEEKGCWGQWSEAEAHRDAGRDRLSAAAVAYFDANPEPKPWDSAKVGEVWEFTYQVPGRADLGYPPVQTITRLYTRTDAGWRSMGRKNVFLDTARVSGGRHVWGPVES
jgi:hypothetical protein